MSGRVIRSGLALNDLEEQSEYIRQRNPRAALRFLNAAEALFRQLASMPGMGERYESKNPLFEELRCFPIPKFPSHIVYYKSYPDGIIVIRVLHGARDIDGVFGHEGAPDEA
jgi:toxin ParE1/3/4